MPLSNPFYSSATPDWGSESQTTFRRSWNTSQSRGKVQCNQPIFATTTTTTILHDWSSQSQRCFSGLTLRKQSLNLFFIFFKSFLFRNLKADVSWLLNVTIFGDTEAASYSAKLLVLINRILFNLFWFQFFLQRKQRLGSWWLHICDINNFVSATTSRLFFID